MGREMALAFGITLTISRIGTLFSDIKKFTSSFWLVVLLCVTFYSAIFPFLNGKMRDVTGTYTATQVMFACLGGVGLLFALLLLRSDKRHGNVPEQGRIPENELP